MQFANLLKLIPTPLLIAIRVFSIIILFLWLAILSEWPQSHWRAAILGLRWTSINSIRVVSAGGYICFEHVNRRDSRYAENDSALNHVFYRPYRTQESLLNRPVSPAGILDTYQHTHSWHYTITRTNGLAVPYWLLLLAFSPLACLGFSTLRRHISRVGRVREARHGA